MEERFLKILPKIQLHGRIFFRHIKCRQSRDEAIAEMVALAWKWFVRLTNRGKDVSKFPVTFCRFAAFAVKSGRRLCGQEKPKDVLSPVAQKLKGFRVESLPVSTRISHENLYGAAHGQREHRRFRGAIAGQQDDAGARASGISHRLSRVDENVERAGQADHPA